ncbi:hypothetical protein [Serratia marcescens]|uniref:hypothetical protein n=1 Tax=Serratia marcescens TaxID=615 RepID=UPI000F83B15A|nr:hypothetical protein [Serratia marcescens]
MLGFIVAVLMMSCAIAFLTKQVKNGVFTKFNKRLSAICNVHLLYSGLIFILVSIVFNAFYGAEITPVETLNSPFSNVVSGMGEMASQLSSVMMYLGASCSVASFPLKLLGNKDGGDGD